MKRYIIFDAFGNSELGTQEDLRDYLINELVDNLKNNYDDKEIIVEDANQLGELAKNKGTHPKYYIQELENYGWYVMDIAQLQKQLSDYQAYKHGVGAPSYPNDCIEQTLKMIEEDMK